MPVRRRAVPTASARGPSTADADAVDGVARTDDDEGHAGGGRNPHREVDAARSTPLDDGGQPGHEQRLDSPDSRRHATREPVGGDCEQREEEAEARERGRHLAEPCAGPTVRATTSERRPGPTPSRRRDPCSRRCGAEVRPTR